MKNYLAFQGDSRAINSFYYTWWLDENEAPLKKAKARERQSKGTGSQNPVPLFCPGRLMMPARA